MNQAENLPVSHNQLFKFSLLVSLVFLIVSLWLTREAAPNYWPHGALAIVCLGIIGLGRWQPLIFHWPYLKWMQFGILLGRVVNPVLLGLVFFGVITPISWLRRSGRIKTGWDPEATSYRCEPEPSANMRDPF